MSTHEEGLIEQYLHQIRALAVRAECGEDVATAVEAVLDEAVKHFRIVKSSDPQANLSAFKGKLKFNAELAHPSQSSFKKTLQYAIEKCPDTI